MTIRRKLLILLLVFAVTPLLVGSTVGRAMMRDLGDRVTEQTRSALREDQRRDLQLITLTYAQAVQAKGDEVDRSLRLFASLAEEALGGRALPGEPAAGEVYDARTDFAPGGRAPGLVAMRDGAAIPGAYESYAAMSTLFVGGEADLDLAVRDAAELSALLPLARRLIGRSAPIKSLYVSTLSGAHMAYPGHSGYPPEYRPHERLWFTSIAEAGAPDIDAASDEDARYRPVWSGPTVDVRTGALVMTLSMGVFDEAGGLAAVAAADVRLDGLLTGLPRLVEWSDEARSLVLYIAADGVADDENIAAAAERGGVNRADLVLIVAEQGDMASGPWDMPPGLRPLLLAEAEDQRQLAETMRAGGSKISTTRLLDGSESVLLAVTPFRPGTAAERSHLAIVVPTSSIEAPAERLSSQLAAQVFTQIATNGAVAVLAVALVIVAGFFASRSVTRPVRELVSTAERISAGDLGARADVDRGDELGTLARAFNEMVPKLRDRMRMQESLTLAMDVQRQLLPIGSPDVPGLDLHGESAYCDETGGDYYDFIALGEEGAGGERTTDGDASRGDDVAVVLGDVTGHGVAAALLMTTARALLRGALSRGGSLAGAISEVNDHLCRDASDGRFMTLCAVATDHGSRELRVVVAGHDAPILFDEATGSITEVLSEPGLPLGVIEGTPYSERRLPALTPSQILVIGTDGVWEAPNDAGEMFGKQRMIEVVEGCCGCTASEVCDRVLKAVSAFRGGAEQRDDITLIVMRGTENAAAEIPT